MSSGRLTFLMLTCLDPRVVCACALLCAWPHALFSRHSMAHKMGNDTAFVLAYSTIMLNTDAHNPRLTGQSRMTKKEFIEGNRRTPDLGACA